MNSQLTGFVDTMSELFVVFKTNGYHLGKLFAILKSAEKKEVK
jgi:hypothetical protein